MIKLTKKRIVITCMSLITIFGATILKAEAATNIVTLKDNMTPFKIVESGETYINIKKDDIIFGDIETESSYTTLDGKEIENRYSDGRRILDLRIFSENQDENNQNKTFVFKDATDIQVNNVYNF